MMTKPTLPILLLAALAAGACSDDPAGPEATTRLRVVHALPDVPSIDVFLDGTAALTNLPFKGGAGYLPVQSGTRNLKIQPTGTQGFLIDQDVTLDAGGAFTVLATGIRASTIAAVLVPDDITDPPVGKVKVRLVHASVYLPNVDVYVTEPNADIAAISPILSNVSYGTASDYLELPVSTYRLRITVGGSKTVAIDVNNLELAAGHIRTAVAVDGPGPSLPPGAIFLADDS